VVSAQVVSKQTLWEDMLTVHNSSMAPALKVRERHTLIRRSSRGKVNARVAPRQTRKVVAVRLSVAVTLHPAPGRLAEAKVLVVVHNQVRPQAHDPLVGDAVLLFVCHHQIVTPTQPLELLLKFARVLAPSAADGANAGSITIATACLNSVSVVPTIVHIKDGNGPQSTQGPTKLVD
jgi:hypothetical protein